MSPALATGRRRAPRLFRTVVQIEAARRAHAMAVAIALRDLDPHLDYSADRLTVTFAGERIQLDLDRDHGRAYVPTFLYYAAAERGEMSPILAEAIECWAEGLWASVGPRAMARAA